MRSMTSSLGRCKQFIKDRDGRTYESLGLRSDQIMVLHFEPALPDRQAEMVLA
jgi:hypothetical protein